jgi:DNA-binding NarL/FixJ family response regulator
MEQHVRVLIADDQVYVRKGLQALLAAWPEVEVVGIGTSGIEVMQRVEQCQPDAILMDIEKLWPNLNGTGVLAGLKTICLIKYRWPRVRLVVLTMYMAHRTAALAAGADAFLLKGCTAEAIRVALLKPGEATLKQVMPVAPGSRPLLSVS